jgi:hypothetical protein
MSLEEFEKWWTHDASEGGIKFNKHQTCLAWKAALEMVLKNNDAYCCGEVDAVGDWTECPTKTVIEKELERKQ